MGVLRLLASSFCPKILIPVPAGLPTASALPCRGGILLVGRDIARFNQQEAARPQFSYFPFSGGLRTCVGWGFAVMEISLVIATIASRWRLELDLDHPLEIDARIAIKPKGGLKVVPHRRSA